MNLITKVFGALRYVANHPLNRNRKFRAVMEWGFIQMAARLVPGDICVDFPNHTRLLVSPRMKGAAHFITPRLTEFEEMALVMHLLRPNELFADVGANIGAFTVLAAGVAGANVMAFEPSPETFVMLEQNVRLNGLAGRVRLFNAALGRKAGEIQFTAGLGTENRVTAGEGMAGQSSSSVRVKMTTLDEALAEAVPRLMKVDVEGFETEVFGGAVRLLQHPQLSAMIVERSGNANRYGFDEAILHQTIRGKGFTPCIYDPFARQLSSVGPEACGNLIYVRDISAANSVLRNAPPFKLGHLCV
jgi:FkbM family methyltransferase